MYLIYRLLYSQDFCVCASVNVTGIIFLFQTFQDEGLSNYIVVYLRLLTSAQLQKKSEFFENFIEGGRTVQEFRSQVKCIGIFRIISIINNK